jgi:group I intron endonuclease
MYKEKKFNFVYLTTNLINNKQYVGDHSTNDLNSRKTINYFGSGIYLKNALNEYKKENFKKQILEFFPTKQKAFDAQENYIIEYNTLSPNGYNISPKGGHNVKGCVSKETREKISKSLIGKPGVCGEKNYFFGKGYLFEGEKNPFYNKNHSIEQREKWSKERMGKTFTEEHKKNMSISFSGEGNAMFGKYGKNNPNFGSKRTEESRKKMCGRVKSEEELQKIRESNEHMKKICTYCNRLIDHRNYKKWHGDKCKMKIKV